MKMYSSLWVVILIVTVSSFQASAISAVPRPSVGTVECYPPPKNVLWRLARKDNTSSLEALLARHPEEVSGRLPCLRNQTLLHQAAGSGAHAAVVLLLGRGADIEARDQDSRTPLLEAARVGQAKTTRVLLERGADPGLVDTMERTALHLGAGHPRVLEQLLRRRAGAAGLLKAVDSAGETPLHRAATAGSAQAVGLLKRAGAEVDRTNDRGETPLHLALFQRHLNATRALLELGASPEAALPDGRRPLHLAVLGDGEEAVRLLLARGAVVSPSSGGVVGPLEAAEAAGRTGIIALLKGSQANKQG